MQAKYKMLVGVTLDPKKICPMFFMLPGCFLLPVCSSELCGDLENLELGDTVEYTLSKGKGNKVSAEKVTKVVAGRQ